MKELPEVSTLPPDILSRIKTIGSFEQVQEEFRLYPHFMVRRFGEMIKGKKPTISAAQLRGYLLTYFSQYLAMLERSVKDDEISLSGKADWFKETRCSTVIHSYFYRDDLEFANALVTKCRKNGIDFHYFLYYLRFVIPAVINWAIYETKKLANTPKSEDKSLKLP